ncbi:MULTISPECIES: type II toxin-antitoxin system RelE/ParE family toxin [unclassified Mesorhizobium]|uniref:type II toxin-antitoxin system RelE/ParE family toxin n=1 Tax=unclassified Mesorhizobium TaxID=325217 RepID=UPI000A0305EE|nr:MULTISPECIES: type II toxin-antitoxin system RelE/ParE family toxin [unclassified Mesorhizobium]WJI76170.1 type II toxin-antitoxin system RelE/ParE family toxin [Mesorhizobium sp. C395A]
MAILKQTATFRRWHQKLKDGRAKAAIAVRLQRLIVGNPGDVAPVGEGISELRIHYGPGYRVYFTSAVKRSSCSCAAGIKVSQETDIRTAKRLAVEWSDDNG